jgi:peptidoglycan/LPS O-acetylase OafA/YrhL
MSIDKNHKPELDGIRGIAILAVMLAHSASLIKWGPVSKFLLVFLMPGWYGVELFFVLSGFLITGILLRSKAADNYFTSFYMRRFLRIFPIYYATLLVLLALATRSPWLTSVLPVGRDRVLYFLYLQNWPVFWSHGFVPKLGNIVNHFWSLAVEEQFYLTWPVLVWLLPQRVLLRFCGAGLVLALLGRIALAAKYGGDFRLMMLTTSRIDGLLIGSGLAILISRGPIPLRWIYWAAGLGLSLLAYIALFQHQELFGTSIYMGTIGIAGFSWFFGAFVALSQRPIPALQRTLSVGWLRAFGKYSYGLYVYHVPLFHAWEEFLSARFGWKGPFPVPLALTVMAVRMALTFVVAKLSFDLFESKILALKRRFEARSREKTKVAEATEAWMG